MESNNFHHLCVFDLITGLKQAKNLLGNLVIFRLNPERSVIHLWSYKMGGNNKDNNDNKPSKL